MVCTLGMERGCPRGVQAHLNQPKKKYFVRIGGGGGWCGLAMWHLVYGVKGGEHAYLSRLLCT